jgi:CheY-like chemotaxis protein
VVETSGRPPLTGTHVLVVDDDVDARHILQAFLAHHGALVTLAGDAVEALSALQRVQVHVIVSDLSMPGMDGHELLPHTRRLPSEASRPTPAIALTSYDSAEHRRRAIDAGFDAYLARPLDPDALVRAIARLVSAREVP